MISLSFWGYFIRIAQPILLFLSIVLFVMGLVLRIKKKKYKKGNICIMIAIVVFCIQFIFVLETSLALKPIIYLYPENEQEVSVQLGYPEKLECVYPKYGNSWKVLAQPNGELVDLKTNRRLYALYWEGRKDKKYSKFIDGFCVKGEDISEFLEDKLKILGLTEVEAEEFIIYWLPKLEKNKYNLIRFETLEEIEENMPLIISPKPDTIIRIMMDVKCSNTYVNIPEQALITPIRKGFVAVEWGGSELK